MGFSTQINSPKQLALTADQAKLIFGTVQMGTTWGMVKSASIERTGTVDELLDNSGNVRAALLRNPQTNLTLTVTWEKGQAGPTLGDLVTFPLVGIKGIITQMSGSWEEAGYRSLQIQARGWDGLANATVGDFDDSSGDFDESA